MAEHTDKPRAYVGHLPTAMTPTSNRVRGEWYVCRPSPIPDRMGEYLHQDGVWRSSTSADGVHGEMTGYFATKEEAEAALAADMQRGTERLHHDD